MVSKWGLVMLRVKGALKIMCWRISGGVIMVLMKKLLSGWIGFLLSIALTVNAFALEAPSCGLIFDGVMCR
jgi:hypothetical protein